MYSKKKNNIKIFINKKNVMAKLTVQEIEATKVIRATFEDSKWV